MNYAFLLKILSHSIAGLILVSAIVIQHYKIKELKENISVKDYQLQEIVLDVNRAQENAKYVESIARQDYLDKMKEIELGLPQNEILTCNQAMLWAIQKAQEMR